MSKYLAALAVLLIVNTSIAADFRSVNWGDSMKKVIATEKKKPLFKKANGIMYKDVLAGIDFTVMYQFVDGKLVAGAYDSQAKHTNLSDYIEDYNKIVSLLIKKYGEALREDINWKNNLYKDDPQHWGTAVSVGHLSFFSIWKTERSYISAGLDGDNFKISHSILYYEKNYAEKRRHDADTKGL